MLILATNNHLANYVNMLYPFRLLDVCLDGWILWKIQGPTKRRMAFRITMKVGPLLLKAAKSTLPKHYC